MIARVENINQGILRQCREQIGMTFSDVEKKIPAIEGIEVGEQKPTFNQLSVLAKLYNVPRWVFIAESLPEEYQFDKTTTAFRKFSDDHIESFNDHKVRKLTTKVEQLRNLILELRNDMSESVAKFIVPKIQKNAAVEITARQVRSWLGTSEHFDFPQWKKKLEDKGIFVFVTSKYIGWSKIDKTLFRGLAIYHSVLPIIIINGSDSRKAQSFSLFHELAHLLRGESAIDDWDGHDHKRIEKWCDELAGNVLIPKKQFGSKASINDITEVKQISKLFKVSAYACLVRLRQLDIIDQKTYLEFEKRLKEEYGKPQNKLKKTSGATRDRPQEVLDQYGHIYTRTLFQSYYNKDIDLHKLGQALDLKRTSHILALGKQL